MKQLSLPARASFEQAIATNVSSGHENEGFLSQEYGFLPKVPPLQALPPSHQSWDAMAARLPGLFKQLSLRSFVDEMPLLPATSEALPDKYLLRASSLLGILAHAYYRVETEPPAQLPLCVIQPWTEVSHRLGKSVPFLSYIDLIMYNWKKRDLAGPIVVENLDLLFPTVGNQEERIFYLTQVEIAAGFAPLVTAVIRSQEAALHQDNGALEKELLLMLQTLQYLGEVSFQKIDPNPYSQTYVDQVVWAKSVAPFAVPINPQTPGPSGTAAPIFHLLDAFFSRAAFDSVLGHEARKLASYSPPAWRNFIGAVAQVSVKAYVDSQPNLALRGLFYQVLEAYAGEKGYLGLHRLKVYGYLENAFKVGRSVTIGGFRGLFRNKTWHQVDRELTLAGEERYQAQVSPYYHAKLIRASSVKESTDHNAPNFIELDPGESGLRYRPGDRVGVLPQNSPELVEKTLRALQVDGEVEVQLNRLWRNHLESRTQKNPGKTLPLQTFLKYGKIRPLTRHSAKQLYSITASNFLKTVLASRTEDQWELWDVLERLGKEGFDPARLWKAGPGEAESICRIVPPETYRLYSIASSLPLRGEAQEELDSGGQRLALMVTALKYNTNTTTLPSSSEVQARYGTASNYLQRVLESDTHSAQNLELKIVPASRFHLPKDPSLPVVMFAAGSGIAPFRGFLQARVHQPGENWLFLAMRTPEQLFYIQDFEPILKAGKLELRVAFSASDKRVRLNNEGKLTVADRGQACHLDTVLLEEENARRLWELLRPISQGGKEAYFYVCGPTDFARSVMDTLHSVIKRFIIASQNKREEDAWNYFYHLVAQRRYLQDIFTTYPSVTINQPLFEVSELVQHNNAGDGYWLAINGKVYDLTHFINLHPGGTRIMAGNAGIDATLAYHCVLHHQNSEIEAQLGMFQIGVMRQLNFREEWATGLGPNGLFYFSLEEAFEKWVRSLYLVTELENSLENEFSFLARKVTAGDTPEEITPLKLQFLIEAHQRILTNYLTGLFDEELAELWEITVGMLSHDLGIDYWQRTLSLVRAGEEFELARRSPEVLQQLLKFKQMEPLARLGSSVVAEDKGVFHALKEVLRKGVKVFESYENCCLVQGKEELISSLMHLLLVVQQYYFRLAQVLQQLEQTDTFTKVESGIFPDTIVPTFLGHGSGLDVLTPNPVED